MCVKSLSIRTSFHHFFFSQITHSDLILKYLLYYLKDEYETDIKRMNESDSASKWPLQMCKDVPRPHVVILWALKHFITQH